MTEIIMTTTQMHVARAYEYDQRIRMTPLASAKDFDTALVRREVRDKYNDVKEKFFHICADGTEIETMPTSYSKDGHYLWSSGRRLLLRGGVVWHREIIEQTVHREINL